MYLEICRLHISNQTITKMRKMKEESFGIIRDEIVPLISGFPRFGVIFVTFVTSPDGAGEWPLVKLYSYHCDQIDI